MKRIVFCLLILSMFTSASWLRAGEPIESTLPGNGNIGQKVILSQEWLGVYVPKSFEGRKANENKYNLGIEFNKKFRYIHSESDVKLRGSASTMDFDYNQDVIDVQIYRSKDLRPGASACMDCHGSLTPRTMAIFGYGKMETSKYKYSGNDVDKAESHYFKAAVDHWMKPSLMLKSELRLGKLEHGNLSDNAKSLSIGLGGISDHKLSWSGDWIISKVDSFKTRNTLIGRISYIIVKGLKFRFEAGAFLDGYTQFGTNMSAMGMATAEPVKKYANWLPKFFKRLKDDKFGYYSTLLEYEYNF